MIKWAVRIRNRETDRIVADNLYEYVGLARDIETDFENLECFDVTVTAVSVK